jgi:hypothetical protein
LLLDLSSLAISTSVIVPTSYKSCGRVIVVSANEFKFSADLADKGVLD